MNRSERIQEFSKILYKSRNDAGISQEILAAELGVSRRTIMNWENGTSFPDAFKMSEWFRICDINPTQYYLQYFNYDSTNEITVHDTDEKLLQSLHDIVDSLSIEEQRQLLFILFGTHGSDPKSVLQMITADLHTPMYNRVNVAQTIIDNYEIAEQRNELVDTEHILPDMENLKSATMLGKQAAFKKKNNY